MITSWLSNSKTYNVLKTKPCPLASAQPLLQGLPSSLELLPGGWTLSPLFLGAFPFVFLPESFFRTSKDLFFLAFSNMSKVTCDRPFLTTESETPPNHYNSLFPSEHHSTYLLRLSISGRSEAWKKAEFRAISLTPEILLSTGTRPS